MKKIPDKRTGKNTMYTIPQLGITALAAFYSRANSLRKFLLSLPGFTDEDMNTFFVALTYGSKPDGLPRKIPTDNHIRSQLDGVTPTIFFEPIWQLITELLENSGDKYKIADRTVIVPYTARHYTSESIACPCCLSKSYETVRRKVFKVEYFHALAGFSLFGEPRLVPQLPPEFLRSGDFPGMSPGVTFRGIAGEDSPEPSLSEVLSRWIAYNSLHLEPIKPLFFLKQGLGTFKAISALQPKQDFLVLLNGETRDTLKRKAPEVYHLASDPVSYDGEPLPDVGKKLHEKDLVGIGRKIWVVPNQRLDRSSPAILKHERSQRVIMTSVHPQEWNIDRMARAINTLEHFNFSHELKRQGFSLTRNFGHGRESLSEVMAILNYLALDLYYLTKF
jgi:hypothetical protein